MNIFNFITSTLLFFFLVFVNLFFTQNTKKNTYLLLIAFMIRMFYGFIKHDFGLPVYYPDAVSFLTSIFNNSVYYGRRDVNFFVKLFSFLAFIFHNEKLLILLNVTISNISIVYIGKISRIIFESRNSEFWTMLLIIISPAYFFYTTDFLRENYVLFFIIIAVYNFILYLNNGAKKNLFLYFVFSILSGLSRSVNIPILFLIGFIGILIQKLNSISNFFRKLLYAFTNFLLIILLLGFVLNILNIHLNLNFINAQLARDQLNLQSVYLKGFRYENWYELFIFLPIRVLYLLFYPFFWKPSNYINMTIVTLSSLYYFCSIFLLIIGYRQLKKYLSNNRKANISIKFIFLFLIVGICIYAIVKSESGARHSLQFMWALSIPLGFILEKMEYNFKKLY